MAAFLFEVSSPLSGDQKIRACRRVVETGQNRQIVSLFVCGADLVTLLGRRKQDFRRDDIEQWLTSSFNQEPFCSKGVAVNTLLCRKHELEGLVPPHDDRANPWYVQLGAAVFVLNRRSTGVAEFIKSKSNKSAVKMPRWTASDATLFSLWQSSLDRESRPEMPSMPDGTALSTPLQAPGSFRRGIASAPPPPRPSNDANDERAAAATAPPVLMRQSERVQGPDTPVALNRAKRARKAALSASPAIASDDVDRVEVSSHSEFVQEPSNSPVPVRVVEVLPPAPPIVSGKARDVMESECKVQLEAILDPYATSVPKTSDFGEVQDTVRFSLPIYPGIDAIKRRLLPHGHILEPFTTGQEHLRATLGPWRVLLHAKDKGLDTLRAYGRLTTLNLSMQFTKIGAPAEATLFGPRLIIANVALVIATPVRMVLPEELENQRDRIEEQPHLYPFALRHDPCTARVKALAPLCDASVTVTVSFLEQLLNCRPRCDRCKRLLAQSVHVTCDFVEPFRELRISAPCSYCQKVVPLLPQALREEQQLRLRLHGFGTMISHTTPRPAVILHHLLGGGSAQPARLNGPNGKRSSFEEKCFPSIQRFMEDHYHEQMSFIRDVGNVASVEASVLASEDDDEDDAAATAEIKLCGDGQHSRQTRAVLKNAPFTCVAFCSLVTGAVVLMLVLQRKDLEAADDARQEAARQKFPDASDKAKREAYVKTLKGFEFAFRGVVFETHYRQAESAGVELGLKILAHYFGSDARMLVAYDKLSAASNLVTKCFPKHGEKLDDPWHVHKAWLPEMDSLAKAHSDLAGLKQHLENPLRNIFKNKKTSTEERSALIKAWKFSDKRSLSLEAAAALKDLLERIAKNFETVKPGFETSLVESFFASHSSHWEKGSRYSYASFFVRTACQVLQWNRVKDWPTVLWEFCAGVLFKSTLQE